MTGCSGPIMHQMSLRSHSSAHLHHALLDCCARHQPVYHYGVLLPHPVGTRLRLQVVVGVPAGQGQAGVHTHARVCACACVCMCVRIHVRMQARTCAMAHHASDVAQPSHTHQSLSYMVTVSTDARLCACVCVCAQNNIDVAQPTHTHQSLSYMMTVSADARLMPSPPARVDRRNTCMLARSWLKRLMRRWRSRPVVEEQVNDRLLVSKFACVLMRLWGEMLGAALAHKACLSRQGGKY